MKIINFLVLLLVPPCVYSFQGFAPKLHQAQNSNTRLMLESLIMKKAKGKEYNKVVDGIMKSKGMTRTEAEKDYNLYLDNPTNYALTKGENYYKSLGYKNLMDGVIGEAEKEGRGEEVRARVEKFKRDSFLKGMSFITLAIGALFYVKFTYPIESIK